MKDKKYEKYIYAGITAAAVVAAGVVLIALFSERSRVLALFKEFWSILAPVIYGAVLAFLLAPFYNFAARSVEKIINRKKKKTMKSFSKFIGTIFSLLCLCIIVSGLVLLIFPQVYSTILNILSSLPVYIENLQEWLTTLFANNEQLRAAVIGAYDQAVLQVQSWITQTLIPSIQSGEIFSGILAIVGGVSSGVASIYRTVINTVISLFVMVYLLNLKDLLAAQSKKLCYAFLPLDIANNVVDEFRYAHKVFSGFLIGKIIDSLIIGVLCYIAMTILKLPFPILVSCVIGITNIIPFFGPFIGAIPSAILIFLVSPIQCLYFVILILVLQQIDGNIIGPRILGNTTGMSSFWVLFSILLFGGLFGFIGMITGVPIMAVIFDIINKFQNVYLKKKDLSTDTEDYYDLKEIDEESGKFINTGSKEK